MLCEFPCKIAIRPARLDNGNATLFFSRLIVAPLSTYPQKIAPGIHWMTRPKNFIKTDTETFFETKIFETETFFWDQIFSRPIPRFFFETKIFETETDTVKKLRKVSIPRSLETRCHTLIQSWLVFLALFSIRAAQPSLTRVQAWDSIKKLTPR